MEEFFFFNPAFISTRTFLTGKVRPSILPHVHTQNNLRTTEGKKCIFLTSIYKRISIKKNVKEIVYYLRYVKVKIIGTSKFRIMHSY